MPQLGLDNYELEYDSGTDTVILRHRGTSNEITFDDGQIPIGEIASIDPTAVLADSSGNRPAAGTTDRLFFETDTATVYHDDGTNWNVLAGDTVDGERNLLPEGSQTGLAADATGVKYSGKMFQQIDAQLLESNRSVYLEAATASSAGDEDVTVEVYDNDAAAVADSIVITGGSSRSRSTDISAALTAGNEVYVRFNVTTASGTSGATFDAIGARLVVE